MTTPKVFYPETERVHQQLGIEDSRARVLINHILRTVTNAYLTAKEKCESETNGGTCTCGKLSVAQLLEDCNSICTNVNEVAFVSHMTTKEIEKSLRSNPFTSLLEILSGK